jgi:hypothetical protein
MAAFGPSTTLPDWVQTQPRRSSHADSVTNQILQASANFQNCPSPAIPYPPCNSSLLLLTRSTLPIQIRAIVVFQVVIVNPSNTHRRTSTNSQPNHIGSLCLCSGGRQKTGSLRNRTPPCYLPIKPTGATRGKMRNQSLKRSPHTHNPNPLQKACLVTQRSQSRNYTIYSAPIYRTICGVVKSPAHVHDKKI